ncbi:MAG: ATP-binding protein [Thermoleophilia bacterium]
MKLRWRLFFSYLAAIAVVVLAVAVSVRSIAVRAVASHMGGMMADMMHSMTADIESAVVAGVTEALLWGVLAALVVAVVASYLLSGWLTGALRHMSEVAGRIARGQYDQRVAYSADDEIGEVARSFNEMATRLEETENLRRQLLGTISHELRTPLTSIQGYMEGLIDGVIPEEPETYQLVHREATRLTRLVADIERLSRVEAGAESIQPADLSTRRVIEETVDRLRPQFEQKPLSLGVELDPGLPDVWADEDKLVQILMNVMGNAFKYTPPGGSVVVRGRSGTDRGSVLFEVEDNGIGIPAEDLPHIFERFYRVDKSRSAAGGGAGIGLAVAKSLVEQMGGHIWAESPSGQGTKVSFTLPSAAGHA